MSEEDMVEDAMEDEKINDDLESFLFENCMTVQE